MKEIQLADGRRVSADKLGFCSVHEHILPRGYPEGMREATISYAAERLNKARRLGIDTIVDVSPWINPAMFKETLARTDMQVVAATGFYVDKSGERDSWSVDDFLRHMLGEAEHGIQGTDIFPGVIKIASADPFPRGWEINGLIAAGRAQRETGLPLCVHSVCGFQRQQALIERGGADLSKVYFSHVEANQGWEGRTFEEEIALMESVLDKGSSLSFNNFNNWRHTPEECMANIILRLAEDDYASRMMATMDFVWSYENGKPTVLWEDICSDGPERDYAYLVSHVVPWMRSKGVPEPVIHAMNHENPARLFG